MMNMTAVIKVGLPLFPEEVGEKCVHLIPFTVCLIVHISSIAMVILLSKTEIILKLLFACNIMWEFDT